MRGLADAAGGGYAKETVPRTCRRSRGRASCPRRPGCSARAGSGRSPPQPSGAHPCSHFASRSSLSLGGYGPVAVLLTTRNSSSTLLQKPIHKRSYKIGNNIQHVRHLRTINNWPQILPSATTCHNVWKYPFQLSNSSANPHEPNIAVGYKPNPTTHIIKVRHKKYRTTWANE